MPKQLFHSIILTLATTFIYFWLTSNTLLPYTLQLVAVLTLIYASIHWLKSSRHQSTHKTPKTTVPIDLTLLTMIMLLLVVETGALASPFIFLLYFLLFAVAMLFEIEATLTLTGVLLVFFLLLPTTDLTDIAHLGELLALIMITPLTLYTAHEHEAILKAQRQSAQLQQHLANEETDTLIFLSTNLKTTLLSALDKLTLIIPQTKLQQTRNNLKTLYSDLRALYRSAQDLEQLIDNETD